MSEGKDILYEVRGKVAIITLNSPEERNSLSMKQYYLLGKLMEKADKDPNTVVTIFQSTGKYFSTGASTNDDDFNELGETDPSRQSEDFWMRHFLARNVWLTDIFHNHSKVLVGALNGPVIGLSTGLFSHCDLIYAMDTSKVYLLAPFANLGLVGEGAACATLFLRLGWSKASEALLFSRPIRGPDLKALGFINQSFDGQFNSTEEFNEGIYKQVIEQFDHLYPPSILANKKLLRDCRDKLINDISVKEAVTGLHRWTNGIPQDRFFQLVTGQIRHKL
ncbi:uncharacterized protein KQ657_002307 [Scheffersomyces spartinae]|uniref:3,2-trans-enoyl-CoA isomerase n=1 Tax=Scheffersomyces spartinae TaxID=45513 RepID=A0A9P7VDG4_9ASCO|nr:uncharacterized protein KQ657_002307 [Scheffersomyces spartinae]KAG7195921.1 hypothetical protein KQ657_002307 [Scheffersomyces spartinae]